MDRYFKYNDSADGTPGVVFRMRDDDTGLHLERAAPGGQWIGDWENLAPLVYGGDVGVDELDAVNVPAALARYLGE